ncbi:MAG TPA: phosphoglycerate dehydrogenase [archaeon]|nr:phosphoglycerate dehydrogenase [archaeon]
MQVFVADKISEEGLAILKKGEFEVVVKTGLDEDGLSREASQAHALVIRSGVKVTRKVIESAKNLKVIGRAGVGVDNVDLEAATERGIVVMNTPSGNTIAAAEHTLGLILSLARNIPRADSSLKSGLWERSRFVGSELNGKTLGVLGLGRIGSEVARLAQAFRMKVIAHDPFIAVDRAAEADITLVSPEDLFAQADIVTLHVPVTNETRGMVNAGMLARMKPTALLINCARGPLVDEKALEEALTEGRIAGAALDVFAKEPPDCHALLANERVVATPHLGASTKEAQLNVGLQIARQVVAALKEGMFDNAVNLPISDFALLEHFHTFIELTERIGVFVAQFVEGGLKTVKISCAGSCSEALQPLKLALLKGLLTPATGGNVNFVNASLLARQRGIKVDGVLTDKADYTNLVSCTVRTDKESCRVDGTVFGDELPRIVRINEFYMDVNPKGHLLVIKNADIPGIIGQVGTNLGKAGINIGEYRLGRDDTHKNTLSLIRVDSLVPDEVIDKLRGIKGIYLVKKLTV